MRTSLGSSLTTAVGALISFLLPAIIVASFPPHGQLAHSPDSLSYLSVAKQLASGHGLTIPNYSLFGGHEGTFTTWPPLFPLILASGIPPLWIQAILFGALGVVTFMLFRYSLRCNWLLATVAALACTLSTPLLMDATYVWSEITSLLFVALSILTLSTIADSNFRVSWPLAVISLALAIYARYAMFLMVPAVMASLLIAPIATKLRIKLAALTPIGITLLTSPLIAHNYFSSQYVSGTYRPISHLGPLANFSDAVLSTSLAFARVTDAKAILVICVIAIASVVIYSKDAAAKDEVSADAAARRLTPIMLIMAATYFIGMIILRSIYTFATLNTRMTSPFVYLLEVTACVYLVYVWRRSKAQRSWERVVLIAPFVALMALSVFTTVAVGRTAWQDWRLIGTPQWRLDSFFVYNNIRPVKVPKISGIVLCDRPMMIQFMTGWNVRQIPDEPYTTAELKRIAFSARAILVIGQESRALVRQIKTMVRQPTVLTVDHGYKVFSWKARVTSGHRQGSSHGEIRLIP